MTYVQEEYYPRRAIACAELDDKIQNDSLMHRILFSDEATFRICGKTKRQNYCIWANENTSSLNGKILA
jgi:hypothetical protein